VRTRSANRVDPLEDGESGVESKAATPLPAKSEPEALPRLGYGWIRT
jgi:hypothetical protein